MSNHCGLVAGDDWKIELNFPLLLSVPHTYAIFLVTLVYLSIALNTHRPIQAYYRCNPLASFSYLLYPHHLTSFTSHSPTSHSTEPIHLIIIQSPYHAPYPTHLINQASHRPTTYVSTYLRTKPGHDYLSSQQCGCC